MIKIFIENILLIAILNITCFILASALLLYYVDLKLNELDLKIRIQELHRELKCSNKWRA